MPYLVVVQCDLLDALATRMIITLATHTFAAKTPDKLSPAITVKSQALGHYAAPLPARTLRKALTNISAQSGALIAAMDVVLSGVCVG
jgi:toxin CcdB